MAAMKPGERVEGPPLEMTLTVPFSREGLVELRRQVDELLGGMPRSQPDLPADLSDADRAAIKVRAVWQRIKETNRQYLATCAGLKDEFTMDDIVAAMGKSPDDLKTVMAYH